MAATVCRVMADIDPDALQDVHRNWCLAEEANGKRVHSVNRQRMTTPTSLSGFCCTRWTAVGAMERIESCFGDYRSLAKIGTGVGCEARVRNGAELRRFREKSDLTGKHEAEEAPEAIRVSAFDTNGAILLCMTSEMI